MRLQKDGMASCHWWWDLGGCLIASGDDELAKKTRSKLLLAYLLVGESQDTADTRTLELTKWSGSRSVRIDFSAKTARFSGDGGSGGVGLAVIYGESRCILTEWCSLISAKILSHTQQRIGEARGDHTVRLSNFTVVADSTEFKLTRGRGPCQAGGVTVRALD